MTNYEITGYEIIEHETTGLPVRKGKLLKFYPTLPDGFNLLYIQSPNSVISHICNEQKFYWFEIKSIVPLLIRKITHQVRIQTNIFNAIQIPTTQEDNAGGITGKFYLFEKVPADNTTNCFCDFVKHIKGGAINFNGITRFDFSEIDINISIYKG